MKPFLHNGRTQAIAIAVVIVIGIAAAIAILRGGAEGHDDHDHEHAETEAAAPHKDEKDDHKDEHADEHTEGLVAMTDTQVRAAGIAIETSAPGAIRATLQLPGEITLDEDRTAHVVPRVAGVVERVNVSLGQPVKKGQLLAVISSAGVAEQRSNLRSARQRLETAQAAHAREKALWEEKISPLQDVQQAALAEREAGIAVANAQQQLAAIGAAGDGGTLGGFELRAPFDGLVLEKHLTLGEMVKEDTNVFTIADLRTVWVTVSVAAGDLARVRTGGKVVVRSTASDDRAEGSVAHVGALIGEQTRTAKARVALPNPGLRWRPGLFVAVDLVTSEDTLPVTVAADAVQTLEGRSVVFVRSPEGFVPTPVRTGRSDGQRVEIVSGLPAGTAHAAAGSFVVKSELGKGSATHSH